MLHFLQKSIRVGVVVALAGVGLLASTGVATAGDCYVPRFTWKTIITYETVRRPVNVWVTRYDHCGRPYRTQVTTWETVRVPVEERVRVDY